MTAATTTSNYGANPELGLEQSKTVDPTGLALTTNMTYEARGASGSFLRQTSKTLSGGNTTTYAHYNVTNNVAETRDSPCTTGATEAYNQAGFIKLKTEPDPDSVGSQSSRMTESIYDDAGRIVATRLNQDAWTCTTYDARGRVITTSISDNDGAGPNTARTITNNYAYTGNPMITSSEDTEGPIITTTDLLGRTTSYQDALSDTASYSYDSLGRLTAKASLLGTEAFTYDSYNRMIAQKLDGTIIATPTYDTYGRLTNVAYNPAANMSLAVGRDTLGRTSSQDYTLGNGTTHLTDTVTRSQSGQITGGTELGQSKAYTYDKAGRLTNASIGNNIWAYGFETPTNCWGDAVTTAPKNANRTSQTASLNSAPATTSTYCYDQADRLFWSDDKDIEMPVCDSHGNTNKVYSLINIHGDTMTTTDASGSSTGTFTYSLFGEVLGANSPTNNNNDGSFDRVGQHEKFTVSKLKLAPIQMGARTYVPSLGKITRVDPVESGVENAYAYPANPISKFDLTGKFAQKGKQSKQPKRLSQQEIKALQFFEKAKQKPKGKDLKVLNQALKKIKTNEKLNGSRQSRQVKDVKRGGGGALNKFILLPIPKAIMDGLQGKRDFSDS